ncbi:MAG: hypothetical protein MI757_09980 [Pirellulales bacterium]|nr:hypothetical protein [Pirellulales bacterium]
MVWSTTDVIIFAVAGYLAVVTLVRLMRKRHEQLIGQVRTRMQAEKRRRARSDKQQPQREEAA